MSETTTMSGLKVWKCAQCGAEFFPRRLLCLRCESPDLREDGHVHEGVIEEITVIRHVLGQEGWKPKRIANVRTPTGLMLTVGLLDESEVGQRIEIGQEGTAPVGQAAR
jgi:uncharacterized OB-fold protein